MTDSQRQDNSPPSAGWWETVTPAELRAAPATINRFLEGNGTASPAQIAAFSRALALQQLLEPTTTPFEKTCDYAYGLLESRFRPGAVAWPLFEWLPRGRAIEKGLSLCQSLLTLPSETEAKHPAFDRYALLLHLAEVQIDKLGERKKL